MRASLKALRDCIEPRRRLGEAFMGVIFLGKGGILM
jgi:hypothetical protein